MLGMSVALCMCVCFVCMKFMCVCLSVILFTCAWMSICMCNVRMYLSYAVHARCVMYVWFVMHEPMLCTCVSKNVCMYARYVCVYALYVLYVCALWYVCL